MPDVLQNGGDVGSVDGEIALDTCTDPCCDKAPPCLARRLTASDPACDVWLCVGTRDESGETVIEAVGDGVAVDFRCRRLYTSDEYANRTDAAGGTFKVADTPFGPCWLLLNPCSGQGRVATVNGISDTPPRVYLNAEALCGCKLLRIGFSHPAIDPLPDGVVDVACYAVDRDAATQGIPNDPGAFLATGDSGPLLPADGTVTGPTVGNVTRVPSGQCCDCVPGCTNTGGVQTFVDACGREVSLACCCSGTFRVTWQGSSWQKTYNEANGGCTPVLATEYSREYVVLPKILVEDGVVTSVTNGVVRITISGIDGATGLWRTDVTEEEEPSLWVVGDLAQGFCPPSAPPNALPGPAFDPATGYGCQGTLCGSTISCDYAVTTQDFSCTGGYGALGEPQSCQYRDFEGASLAAVVVERIGDCTGGCPGTPSGGGGGGGFGTSGLFAALVGGV